MAMQLRRAHPAESEAILGRVRARQQKYDEAATHIYNSYVAYRTDPWPTQDLMGRNFDVATSLARRSPAMAAQMFAAIDKPFAAGQWEDARKYYRVFVAEAMRPCGPAMLRALGALEPWTPWRENVLRPRADCYSRAHLTGLAQDARDDLREFMTTQPRKLEK